MVNQSRLTRVSHWMARDNQAGLPELLAGCNISRSEQCNPRESQIVVVNVDAYGMNVRLARVVDEARNVPIVASINAECVTVPDHEQRKLSLKNSHS